MKVRVEFPKCCFCDNVLTTTISGNAAKKAFLDFVEVLDVIAGKFKTPYNGISNDKHHIRITTCNDSRPFQVMWAKKVSCKNCICVHMQQNTCHSAPDSLTNEGRPPDNRNIALASMKSWVNELPLKAAAPNSNTVAAAPLDDRPTTCSSERPHQVQGPLIESLGSGYTVVVQ